MFYFIWISLSITLCLNQILNGVDNKVMGLLNISITRETTSSDTHSEYLKTCLANKAVEMSETEKGTNYPVSLFKGIKKIIKMK